MSLQLFGGSDNTYEKAASFKDMALGVYKLTQLKVVEHKANGTQYIGYVKDIDGKMALDKPVWLPSSISSKLSYDQVSYVNDKAKCGVFMYIENKGVQPGSSKNQMVLDVVFVKKPVKCL